MRAPWRLEAGPLLAGGLRDLFRPPFALMLGLNLLIYFALTSVSATVDESGLFGTLVLVAASSYVQIAMIVAAGGERNGSADFWLKQAIARRVFWRFILTGFVSVVVILFGFLILVVGGFVAGAMLALAQPASVQERLWPFAAIRRGLELSQGARVPIGTVFGLLYLAPTLLQQVGLSLRWDASLGWGWTLFGALSVVLTSAGVIALTHAYVKLGGAPSPFVESGARS